MHFNPENNYYITLGLPRNASQDAIRERWKRLMLLYHPDHQQGDEEWVSERAKKVNEAYNTLKDDSKRMAYDKKLIEDAIDIKPSSLPRRKHWAFLRSRTRGKPEISLRGKHTGNYTMDYTWPRTRRYLPRILVGLYILAALVFIAFIYIQNRSSHIETSLIPAPNPLRPAPSSVIASPESSGQSNLKPDSDRHAPSAMRQTPTSVGSNPPAQNAMRHAPSAMRQTPTSVGSNPPAPSSLRPAPIEPSQITKTEVENFIQQYITAYEKSDINTFMSLFSYSAVENNYMDYEAILMAYKDTFSEKIKYYKLQDISIRIEGPDAFVSGVYNIERYFSAEDQWNSYTGKIYWKLVKENDSLKIISMNYDK